MELSICGFIHAWIDQLSWRLSSLCIYTTRYKSRGESSQLEEALTSPLEENTKSDVGGKSEGETSHTSLYKEEEKVL